VFGGRHAWALLDDGTVSCWGLNNLGQLGPDAGQGSAAPKPVADLSRVVQLDAGCFYTCALRRDGTVWCWGENDDGELGDRGVASGPDPVTVALP
jgi:alpha-tubulin suppressor-like RCC1 family protein